MCSFYLLLKWLECTRIIQSLKKEQSLAQGAEYVTCMLSTEHRIQESEHVTAVLKFQRKDITLGSPFDLLEPHQHLTSRLLQLLITDSMPTMCCLCVLLLTFMFFGFTTYAIL
jgi:hypothetical protein